MAAGIFILVDVTMSLCLSGQGDVHVKPGREQQYDHPDETPDNLDIVVAGSACVSNCFQMLNAHCAHSLCMCANVAILRAQLMLALPGMA